MKREGERKRRGDQRGVVTKAKVEGPPSYGRHMCEDKEGGGEGGSMVVEMEGEVGWWKQGYHLVTAPSQNDP